MIKSVTRAALVAGAALIALSPASSTNSWGGYHWAWTSTTLPVPLKINTAIDQNWTTAVGAAVADWKGSSRLSLTQLPPSGLSAKRCSSITGQILVCNYSYGQRGWLGLASISLSGLHITSGTTKLNDTYFNMAQYNTPGWRAMVACQEIGHDFGLDHQDTVFDNFNLGTCMDYTNQPDGGTLVAGGFDYGPSNTKPNQHDYDELLTIYNHADATTTTAASTNFGLRQVGQAAPQSASFDPGDSPAEWGRAIHSDAAGRPNVYMRKLGNGQTVLTHVFWAIGEGPGHS